MGERLTCEGQTSFHVFEGLWVHPLCLKLDAHILSLLKIALEGLTEQHDASLCITL